MTYSHNAPFRADVVGSYLRPAELKQARADFAAGAIDAAALKAVEDRLITELVAKQKAAGLHVITDGEFRRGWWHFDFMWASTVWIMLPPRIVLRSTTRSLRPIPPL